MAIFDIGPFRLYRVENGTLDISLICMEDWPCGWEWGRRDEMRGTDNPIIELRIGKLMVAYLQFFEGGCEIWFMGFWAFPSWNKKEKTMQVYQVIDDCLMEEHVYGTKEAAAMKVLEIVMKAKGDSLLNDLIRVYALEVK